MLELDRIYNIDCLLGMRDIPDKSIDAIICDLPYGTTSCDFDTIIPFEPLWDAYKRIIKPNGNIILFASGRFVFSLYASQPKLFRYDMVWEKSKCGSPLTAKYMPLKKHEHILVFGRSGAKYNPQMTTGGTPYKKDYEHCYNKNNHKYGVTGVHTDNHGERHPTTILKFAQKWRRQDQLHPTQKPVELMQWLIRAYSNPEDTILDNCMGSGSTIVAAIRENRRYIGMELDEGYFNTAKYRIEREMAQPTLF